jgi:hypothetical protein
VGLLAGCFGGEGGGEVRLQIGIPDPEDDLQFMPLEPGGDIPLQTFGQGGTHALLALRTIGFGQEVFTKVTLENVQTGASESTVEGTRPMLLLCRDESQHVCDLIPMFVLTGGIAAPDEKDGLAIRVLAEAHNDAGLEATAEIEGVLRAEGALLETE